MSNQKPWTADEVEQLKNLYPTNNDSELSTLLGRSAAAIRLKANSLGLTKQKFWTQERTAYLSKHQFDQSPEEIARYLGMPVIQVQRKLYTLSSVKRRKKRKITYTGCELDCENCKYHDCIAPPSVCMTGLDDGINDNELRKENRT